MNETLSPPADAAATTENVLGRRIVAGIIDLVIVLIGLVVFTGLFGDTKSEGGSFSASLEGWPAVFALALSISY